MRSTPSEELKRERGSWRGEPGRRQVASLIWQAADTLEAIRLPPTFTVSQLRRRIEDHRSRSLQLIARELPAAAPHGLWIAVEHADYVFYDCTAGQVRQHQIIGHELVHILLDHTATSTDHTDLVTMLAPDVDPATLRNHSAAPRSSAASSFNARIAGPPCPNTRPTPLNWPGYSPFLRVAGDRAAAVGVLHRVIGVRVLGHECVKVRDLLNQRSNRPLRYLCLALVSITLGMSLQPVAWKLDQWAGVLDLGRVLANCLTLISVSAGRGRLIAVVSPDEPARRQLLWMLACAAMIVGLLAVTPPAYDLADPYVRGRAYNYATAAPAAAPWGLVYLVCLRWACLRFAASTLGYARVTARPLVRAGMRMTSVGVQLASGYVVVKVAAMVAVSIDVPTAPFDRAIIPCYSAAILAVLFGSTVPSWGPWIGLDRLLDTFLAWRDCRRSQPLWRAMYAAVPQIALLPHPADPALRHIRLTVEILDAYVLLSRWTSPDDMQVARDQALKRGKSTVDASAEAEATVISLAISRRLAGEQPSGEGSLRPSPPFGSGAGGSEPTGADQVLGLARVARAIRRGGRRHSTVR